MYMTEEAAVVTLSEWRMSVLERRERECMMLEDTVVDLQNQVVELTQRVAELTEQVAEEQRLRAAAAARRCTVS
jgi:uncharacterized protein YlxW (UPF0749 family)